MVLVAFHVAVFVAMTLDWRPYSRVARFPFDLSVLGMGASLGFAIFLTSDGDRVSIWEVLPVVILGLGLLGHVGVLVLHSRRSVRLLGLMEDAWMVLRACNSGADL